jgi:thioredoxin-related protein
MLNEVSAFALAGHVASRRKLNIIISSFVKMGRSKIMIKLAVSVVMVLIFSLTVKSQEHPVAEPIKGAGLVKWMTFEQAIEKSKTEKRSIFIDVYTDWCGWCKVMDKNTFNEPTIAKLLNEKYYPVKFDAEQQGDVIFNGTTYKFVPYGNKGTHQFAMALLNNQLSYPTVVFMDRDLRSVFPIAGYRQPPEFHKYLSFFSEDQSKSGQNAWAEFEKKYRSPYGETPQAATSSK